MNDSDLGFWLKGYADKAMRRYRDNPDLARRWSAVKLVGEAIYYAALAEGEHDGWSTLHAPGRGCVRTNGEYRKLTSWRAASQRCLDDALAILTV